LAAGLRATGFLAVALVAGLAAAALSGASADAAAFFSADAGAFEPAAARERAGALLALAPVVAGLAAALALSQPV